MVSLEDSPLGEMTVTVGLDMVAVVCCLWLVSRCEKVREIEKERPLWAPRVASQSGALCWSVREIPVSAPNIESQQRVPRTHLDLLQSISGAATIFVQLIILHIQFSVLLLRRCHMLVQLVSDSWPPTIEWPATKYWHFSQPSGLARRLLLCIAR